MFNARMSSLSTHEDGRAQRSGGGSMCYVCAHRLIIQASALLTVNICMGELWRINAVRGGYSGTEPPSPLNSVPRKMSNPGVLAGLTNSISPEQLAVTQDDNDDYIHIRTIVQYQSWRVY